jgi:hypothetical protein
VGVLRAAFRRAVGEAAAKEVRMKGPDRHKPTNHPAQSWHPRLWLRELRALSATLYLAPCSHVGTMALTAAFASQNPNTTAPVLVSVAQVMIETVDSFQGKQLDVVMLSCVRASCDTGGPRNVGFVSDLRRLNVVRLADCPTAKVTSA